MQALDLVYGWTLPGTFPPQTPLGTLWAVPITVEQHPRAGVLYAANGTAPYSVSGTLSGIVAARVLGTDTPFVAPLTTKENA